MFEAWWLFEACGRCLWLLMSDYEVFCVERESCDGGKCEMRWFERIGGVESGIEFVRVVGAFSDLGVLCVWCGECRERWPSKLL